MIRDWNEIDASTELPVLEVTPTRVQLFMFSAATWNRHHVHFSRDAALSEGLPDVVVHRALLGDYLARMLTNWLGDAGEIRQLNWRVQQSAIPDKPLRCSGKVQSKTHQEERRFASCIVEIRNEGGEVIASGDARLEFLPGGAQ